MEFIAKTKKRLLEPALLFGAFMYLQYVILRAGNQAGRGYLPGEVQEYVYYMIQGFVILGFLAHAFLERRLPAHVTRIITEAALLLIAAGSAGMLIIGTDTLASIIFTFVSVTLLGCIGGAVYLRMARYLSAGYDVSLGFSLGCAFAVLLQYFTQLRFSLIFALIPLALISAGVLFALLRREPAEPDAGAAEGRVRAGSIVFTVLCAALLLSFTSFYNGYIHHLQIASGYTDYNVYSWPRLMMIPGFIIFGLIGRLGSGRYVPIAALCAALAALLNSVLVSVESGYFFNMCLFYVAISASVSYYNMCFWRLAARVNYPSLLACAGRILDSFIVVALATVGISTLPSAAVLTINIIALVLLIILMAANGDMSFSKERTSGVPSCPETRGSVTEDAKADPFETIMERYSLTPAELSVFRELVLTEDKQTVIGDRLSIKLRTVQANVTSIYNKTGVSTRAGLVGIYRDVMEG